MQQQQEQARQAQLHAYAMTCETDYKAKPGTTAFTQCMIALGQQQQAAEQQRMAIALTYMGAMKADPPDQLPMPTYSAPRPPVYGGPINCTSSPVGTTVNTNCH